MRLALDAMGGDHAPGPIVAGAVQAVVADLELQVTLVGDRAAIEAHLGSDAQRDRLDIFHCTQVVGMEESPVIGLRKKPDNSISRCWQLLAQGKVDGIISAGNTGAMVAGGLFLKRFLPRVRRPGIAALIPTFQGFCVMLDVGANINPEPEHLFQYGVMGSLFVRNVLKKDRPTIGLMNVGSEEAKGHSLAKDTHALFNASPLREQFIGNVEGRDVHSGSADVVVTDGFVGNVVLKACEGTFDFTMKMAAQEMLAALDGERSKGEKALASLAQRYHYSAFGGAPLLGIDGVCLICHGSSKERAIKNALAAAAGHVRSGLNQLIVKELENLPMSAGT